MAWMSYLNAKLGSKYSGNLEKILEKSGDFQPAKLEMSKEAGYDGCYNAGQSIQYQQMKFLGGYSKSREDSLIKIMAKELGGLFSKADIVEKKESDDKSSITVKYKAVPTLASMIYRGGKKDHEVELTINRKDGTVDIKYTMTPEKGMTLGGKVIEKMPISPNTIKGYLNKIYAGLARYGIWNDGLQFVYILKEKEAKDKADKEAAEKKKADEKKPEEKPKGGKKGEEAPAEEPAKKPKDDKGGAPQPTPAPAPAPELVDFRAGNSQYAVPKEVMDNFVNSIAKYHVAKQPAPAPEGLEKEVEEPEGTEEPESADAEKARSLKDLAKKKGAEINARFKELMAGKKPEDAEKVAKQVLAEYGISEEDVRVVNGG